VMVAQATLRDTIKTLPGATFQDKELSESRKDRLGFRSRGASRLGRPAFC
jgi:ribosomal protein L34